MPCSTASWRTARSRSSPRAASSRNCAAVAAYPAGRTSPQALMTLRPPGPRLCGHTMPGPSTGSRTRPIARRLPGPTLGRPGAAGAPADSVSTRPDFRACHTVRSEVRVHWIVRGLPARLVPAAGGHDRPPPTTVRCRGTEAGPGSARAAEDRLAAPRVVRPGTPARGCSAWARPLRGRGDRTLQVGDPVAMAWNCAVSTSVTALPAR